MATLFDRAEDDVFEGQRWDNSILSDSTESVYSLQGRETEIVADTTDTDSCEESIIDIEIEYDVASLSENEDYPFLDTSSGEEDFITGVIVNALCDSSLDAFATDNESSDNSMDESLRLRQVDFAKCVQCGGVNTNSLYRYCDRCFQARKTIFPPRPQTKCKKRNDKKKIELKHNLEHYLSANATDSGIGSETISSLDFENIVVPEDIKNKLLRSPIAQKIAANKEKEKSDDTIIEQAAVQKDCEDDKAETIASVETNIKENDETQKLPETKPNLKRKRNDNELEDIKKRKVEEKSESKEKEKEKSTETSELCIICNTNSKNSIFLHGNIGHMACCYKCSMLTWRTNKRCPICNCKVNNVVKVSDF